MTAKGSFFPRRINDHVPNMQYAADVRFGGLGTIVIPAPAAAAAIKAGIANNGDALTTSVNAETDAKFGRNVSAVASAAVGAGTAVVLTVRGKDYLGQPMVESISIAHATGTTAVAGKKAFKWIDSITSDGGGGDATTSTISWGNVLGLPYKSQKLISELVSKEVPGNAGTFVDGAATGHTSSVTSDDPRGTYAPHASFIPNGSREYTLNIHHDTDNLHGDPHFYS